MKTDTNKWYFFHSDFLSQAIPKTAYNLHLFPILNDLNR